MKKCIFTLLLLGGMMSANAQVTLATFEDLTADNLCINADTWYEGGRYSSTPQVGDNPAKDETNGSDKCLVMTNVADADWWGNFFGLKLTTPIVITQDNRFLSFKCYRSIQPKDFRIYINEEQHSGKDSNIIFEAKVKKDGEWNTVVIDLGEGHMGEEFSSLFFITSCNWSDPRSGWGEAVYAFDDFKLQATSGEDVEVFSGTLADFEDQTFGKFSFDDSSINKDQFSQIPQVLSNPLKEGVNTSDYCFGATNTAAVPQWWMNIARLALNTPTLIDESNRYLVMKAFRSAQTHNFRVGFNGHEDNNKLFDGMLDETGKWCLLVMDMGEKYMGSTLKEIRIIYSDNWGGETDVEATYCFDDIAIVSEAEKDKIVEESTANGISIVKNDEVKSTTYDLRGIIVKDAQKGIVIKNGRKYVK